MRVSVHGRDRDHGTWTIIEDDLRETQFLNGNSFHEASIQVGRSETGTAENVVVSKASRLRLNGNYVVEAEFSPDEIARLFYLTHSNINLHDLVEGLTTFKTQEDERVKAAAELRRKLANVKLAHSIKRRV